VFWSNKTETFICIEPLNCTFTHIALFVLSEKYNSDSLSPSQSQTLNLFRLPK
ncbi:MAG: hypothetical protein ACI89W_000903, partial [Gammaproteobacteria bacterium]